MTINKILVFIIVIALALFGLIQLVPYGRNHDNPPVGSEPAWDTPATRSLAQRACFDCHSNETAWPWYSHVAPMSWLIQHDVEEGRDALNFSSWGRGEQEVDDAAEVIRSGEMPPPSYVIIHPDARLSADERQQLIDGLVQSMGAQLETEMEHEDDD